VADAQVAPRVPDATGPSTTAPGVDSTSLAPAANTCHACGKSDGKLLRCGGCRAVWFCNRECQVLAARQGHSGANCRPAGGVPAAKAADAQVAPRVLDAAEPSTTAPGVDSTSLAPAANTCHACGKSDGKLLQCGRCRGVWFCNRECQDVARKELGHRGANCRPADKAQIPQPLAHARSPFAAPSQPSSPMVVKQLTERYADLADECLKAIMKSTRVGYLAAVEKAKEAAAVADLIGGAQGADRRSQADLLRYNSLLRLGNLAAAARAACSSLRAARESGSMTAVVTSLTMCGNVAREAPAEMALAEKESREQERLSGSRSYGGPDLSQEGRVSLPTNPAALSRLSLAYNEAAVAACDSALAAAGGRDSPAADDERQVPSLGKEAQLRSGLGLSLHDLGERKRGLKLIRQALALLRRTVQKAAPGSATLIAEQGLAALLCNLGGVLITHGVEDSGNAPGSDGLAEAEACLRKALALCEDTDNVMLKQTVLRHLANMSGRPDQPVGPAEAAALRSRLNALYAQTGRNHDTSCTICLETLEQPDGGPGQDAADRVADGYTNSAVFVMKCGHQFHRGCLSTWWRTQSEINCPLCKK